MRMVGVLLLVAALSGSARAGATFEIGTGGGTTTVRTSDTTDTKGVYTMPAIGAGGWLGEHTTLTGRILLSFVGHTTFVHIGGGLQYWPNRRFFVGGGLGYAAMQFDQAMPDGTKGYGGLGLDLRAGLNLRPESAHAITLSLELTPGILKDHQLLGAMLLASYQYL